VGVTGSADQQRLLHEKAAEAAALQNLADYAGSPLPREASWSARSPLPLSVAPVTGSFSDTRICPYIDNTARILNSFALVIFTS
jgi:hypothetical protein